MNKIRIITLFLFSLIFIGCQSELTSVSINNQNPVTEEIILLDTQFRITEKNENPFLGDANTVNSELAVEIPLSWNLLEGFLTTRLEENIPVGVSTDFDTELTSRPGYRWVLLSGENIPNSVNELINVKIVLKTGILKGDYVLRLASKKIRQDGGEAQTSWVYTNLDNSQLLVGVNCQDGQTVYENTNVCVGQSAITSYAPSIPYAQVDGEYTPSVFTSNIILGHTANDVFVRIPLVGEMSLQEAIDRRYLVLGALPDEESVSLEE